MLHYHSNTDTSSRGHIELEIDFWDDEKKFLMNKWPKQAQITIFKKQAVWDMAHHEVGWSVGFYGISTFVGYLTPNPFFLQIVLFQTILFSISTQFNCKKTFLFQAIQFIQTVLIQFSISTNFIYTELNVKIVLYKKFSLA